MYFEDRNNKWLERIVLIICTMLITFLATIAFLYKRVNINYVTSSTDYSLLNEVMYDLKKYYLNDVGQDKELIEGAAEGLVDAVGDRYTQYITTKEVQDFTTNITGSFAGIGVYLTADTDKNEIVVVAPIEDSPAEKAGIKSGDVIKKVDDVEYTAETMDEALEKIKGEVGTEVKITIKRDGKEIEKNVTREKVKIRHVTSKVLNKTIGYVSINSFDEGCAQEFKEKVNELISKDKITSLIIDIRNNPGGILDEVLSISNYLLPECEIISIVDKDGNKTVEKSDSQCIDLPLIILTNGNSASASEILAGSIKDNNRGKLVGTKTFGKGVIQEVITLSNGAMLKITTSEYCTPSGNKIQNQGIEPDITVELPEKYQNTSNLPEEKEDTQLGAALKELK